mmetsp:Transcript_13656/g.61315  ORF Transcript_13656/g.61315 Transcript_13656/m.61315 type:complete len:133 (-) Transcript_13656:121-519(-)
MRATNYSDAHADMTIIDYSAGTLKDMGLAQAKVVTMDDKTTMEITLKPGFDWLKEVSPKLPGCPEWCPANHFGYLQSGTMKVQYKDGSTETVNAGSSYNIPPGHLPEVIGDIPCVMVEFSQSTAAVVKDMKD